MADTAPQYESSDNSGSTKVYTGTATTSVANVPAVSGEIISQVGIVAR